MSCDHLIEHKPEQGYTVAFSRTIDNLLHADIPYTPENQLPVNRNVRLAIRYPEFIEHQKNILAAVEGCEKQIFNDPRVYYGTKDHLSGETGTMTSMLVNGFLHLYNQLLERVPSLKVNADNDLRVLLHLVQCTPIKDGVLQMPPEELTILRAIVAKLYPKRRGSIFTPQWYALYERTMQDLDNLFFDKYKYYIFTMNGEPHKRGAGQAGESVFNDETLTEAQKNLLKMAKKEGFMPMYDDPYKLWETHPPYVSITNLFGAYTADEMLTTYIPLLKTIFPPVAVGGRRRRHFKTKRHAKRKAQKTRRHH